MRRYKVEIFDDLVDTLNSLPSIGKKNALKIAHYLAVEDKFKALRLIETIESVVSEIRKCSQCNSISTDELCPICSDELRDFTKLCILQSAKDIFTIENTTIYDGLYYVLEDINLVNEEHLKRVIDRGVREIIFAFPPSLANDAIILYIEEKLKDRDIEFFKIAQGVPTGVELDSIDAISLAKAIKHRVKV